MSWLILHSILLSIFTCIFTRGTLYYSCRPTPAMVSSIHPAYWTISDRNPLVQYE